MTDARKASVLRTQAWRKRHPEKARAADARQNARRNEQRKTIDGFINATLRQAKVRHKRKFSCPCDITFEYLRSIVPADRKCPVLGIPMNFASGTWAHPATASLDRKNPTVGYVVGNVRWISFRANHVRSDSTLAELRAAYWDAATLARNQEAA